MKKFVYGLGLLFVFGFIMGFSFAQEYEFNTVNSNGVANYPHEMTINADGYPIMVYQDTDDGDRLKVRQWDGSVRSDVGASSWPTVSSTHHDIAVGSDGLPVVVYTDMDNSYWLSVIKYDGSQWNYLGGQYAVNTGIATLDDITYTHISIGSDNLPIVEYPRGWGMGTYAMKWNGTSWTSLGKVSDGTGETRYQSLVLNTGGVPYISYLDNTIDAVIVKYYSGGTWLEYGPHITGSNLEGSLLAINEDGEVFVFVMDDLGFRSYGSIKFSTGLVWEDFGDGVDDGSNFTIQDMVINPFDGYPIVAYKKGQNSFNGETWSITYYTNVARWNGSEWIIVKSEVLQSESQNLAINDLGQIYVSQGGGNTYLINPYFRAYFGVNSSIYWENLYNPLLASLFPNNGPASLVKGNATTFTVEVPANFSDRTLLSPWGNRVLAEKKTDTKVVYYVIGYKSVDGISVASGK